MHRFILTIFIGHVLLTGAHAQTVANNVDILWADAHMEAQKDVTYTDAIQTESGYLILKREPISGPGGWLYYLEEVNSDLEHVRSKSLEGKINEDEHLLISKIVKTIDGFFLFSRSYDKQQNSTKLFIQEIDVQNLTLSDRNEIGSVSNIEARALYGVVTSTNNKSMMVYVKDDQYKNNEIWGTDRNKGKIKNVSMVVLNSKGLPQWEEKNYALNDLERNNDLMQLEVSDEGIVYLITKQSDIEHEKKMGVTVNSTETRVLELIIADGKKIVKTKFLTTNNQILLNAFVKSSLYQNLLVYGFLGEGTNGANFMFSKELDPLTGNELKSKLMELDTSLMGKLPNRQQGEAGENVRPMKTGLDQLRVTEVHQQDNGKIIVMAQRFYQTIYTPEKGASRIIDNYEDILVSKFDRENNLLNHSKILMKGSFLKNTKHFDLNEKICFVFSDYKTRIEVREKGIENGFADTKHCALCVLTLHGDNTQSKGMFYDYSNSKYKGYRRYKTNDLINLENGQLITSTYYGKKKFGVTLFKVR